MRRAMGFLTVLGGAASPSAGAVPWFPVVGALLGLAVGGVWVGAGHVWPPAAAAAVTVAVDAILTGGLHLDGLVDSGDGLVPALPRERRLEVMSDPHVGAFGVITLVVVMLVRFGAFAAGPAVVWPVAGLWCGSRSAVAVLLLLGRYARSTGLATLFGGGDVIRHRRVAAIVIAVVGLGASLAGLLVRRPGHGAAALAAELFVMLGITAFAYRRLGGYTGDVLGAQIVIGETAGLLVWATRW